MSRKTKYLAAAPDGGVHTRESSHDYTHAVLIYGPSWNNPDDHWGPVAFNSRLDLAEKEAYKWRKCVGRTDLPLPIKDVIIVTVTTES